MKKRITHDTVDRSVLERDIKSIIMSHDYIKAVHAFVIEPKRHLMSFDVVAGYGAPPDDVIRQQVVDAVQDRFPTYAVAIVVDRDYA